MSLMAIRAAWPAFHVAARGGSLRGLAKADISTMHALTQSLLDEAMALGARVGDTSDVQRGTPVAGTVDSVRTVAVGTDGRTQTSPKETVTVGAAGVFPQLLIVALPTNHGLIPQVNGRPRVLNWKESMPSFMVPQVNVARIAGKRCFVAVAPRRLFVDAAGKARIFLFVALATRPRHLAKRQQSWRLAIGRMGKGLFKTLRIAPMAMVALDRVLKMHVRRQTLGRDEKPLVVTSPELRRTVTQDARVHIVGKRKRRGRFNGHLVHGGHQHDEREHRSGAISFQQLGLGRDIDLAWMDVQFAAEIGQFLCQAGRK